MRIGAHVRRRSRGTGTAVDEVAKRGADCAQIFVSNPRGWAPPRVHDDDVTTFRDAWLASGFHPLIAHAPYLVNIGSPNPEFRQRSRSLVASTLEICERLGADALVVHAGLTVGGEHREAFIRAARSLASAAAITERVQLLVEPEEGISTAIASTIAESARLLEAAGNPTIGLCLDTCHLFATGYRLDVAEGIDELFAELRAERVDERVVAFHANDSVFECGARRDRHTDIGDGRIGADGFRALMTRPECADLAFILETPGDAVRQGADIALLRGFADQGSSSARGPSW